MVYGTWKLAKEKRNTVRAREEIFVGIARLTVYKIILKKIVTSIAGFAITLPKYEYMRSVKLCDFASFEHDVLSR